MKLVDVNILLCAVNEADPQHETISAWLEAALNGEEPIGVCWHVLIGFLRISTDPRAIPRPLSMAVAVALVNDWLLHPNVQLVTESEDHWQLLKELVHPAGVFGKMISDVHLAALAIGNRCTLASCDGDFSRFRRLNWENPLRA
jgi:toxin-antitoxin system PIN domain toxin